MFCCVNNPYYLPVSTDEKAAQERCRSDGKEYPGNSRAVSTGSPPTDSVLLKTGGNALIAVDRTVASSKDMVAVSVPWNVTPGQTIIVNAPGDSGRSVTATVPEGVFAGHTFMVRFPATVDTALLVTGVPFKNSPEQKQSYDDLLSLELKETRLV